MADAPPESETTHSEKAQAASKEEESPLIKELEAKDREIIDLKVPPPARVFLSKPAPSHPLRRKRKGEQRKFSDNVWYAG